jgi:hypothetical protein
MAPCASDHLGSRLLACPKHRGLFESGNQDGTLPDAQHWQCAVCFSVRWWLFSPGAKRVVGSKAVVSAFDAQKRRKSSRLAAHKMQHPQECILGPLAKRF